MAARLTVIQPAIKIHFARVKLIYNFKKYISVFVFKIFDKCRMLA